MRLREKGKGKGVAWFDSVQMNVWERWFVSSKILFLRWIHFIRFFFRFRELHEPVKPVKSPLLNFFFFMCSPEMPPAPKAMLDP